MSHFSLTKLTLGVTTALTSSLSFAAAMDRSGQDVTAFLQDGTYAEAVYTHIDANVTGHDNAHLTIDDLKKYTKGNPVNDAAKEYDFFRYGVKADVNDTFSVGVLYDEPFGAAAQYEGNSNFVTESADSTYAALVAGTPLALKPRAEIVQTAQQYQNAGSLIKRQIASFVKKELTEAVKLQIRAQNSNLPANQVNELARKAVTEKVVDDALNKIVAVGNIAKTAETHEGQGTNVEIRTNNLTMLVGAKFGANKNLQIYGGPALQQVKADVALRGPAYLTSAGYDAHVSPQTKLGWVAGAAYSIPEIAFRAAVTYRSEIDYEAPIGESLPSLNYLSPTMKSGIEANVVNADKVKITTPQSVNFNLQTGISREHQLLGTLDVRWVPWSDFKITPPLYHAASKVQYPKGLNLVQYSKDQWKVDLGLGKRFNDKLSGSVNVGWDSGAGNPVSSLGPVNGYYSVGGGVKYNFTPEWALSVGGKYLKFGDATAELPNGKVVGEFKDNDGYAVGVKLAYQGK
ncbi:hypothetical protein B0682_08630 [Moraxella lincolnii]|uniref:Long-chain fatty acid transporter n=1 Tax=Lwoffella lincolnii TaxID=90241 RepID=A0A1T0CB73_9GAMM|nr:outer membrane protein transport protein [Moraxella lincolnii]OOS19592.1 hypothetical protein B0682_08630 [Moraxella lincolnii]